MNFICPFGIHDDYSTVDNFIQELNMGLAVSSNTTSYVPDISATINDENMIKNLEKKKIFFPHLLMQLISSPRFADCVTWSGDGEAFIFLDQDRFVQKLNHIARQRPPIKTKSLTRRLNRLYRTQSVD